MSLCKVGLILKAIESEPVEEQKAFLNALNARKRNGSDYLWSGKNLANALNNTPYSAGETTIKAHRRQACGCF